MSNTNEEFKVVEKVHVEGAVAPTETNTETTTATTETTAEPAAETTTTATAEQPSFDWLKEFNVNSREDLQGIISQRQEYQQKIAELEGKTQPLPYKTDFARIADELSAKGISPETIAKFHNLDETKMSDKDVILQRLELKHPTMGREKLEAFYSETYGELDNPDSILTDGAKAALQIKQQEEGASARNELRQYKYEALNPNQVAPEIQQQEQSRQEWWKTSGLSKINAGSEVKFGGNMKLPIGGNVTEQAHDFIYKLPDTEKQAILKELGDTVTNPMYGEVFGSNEQAIQKANDTFERLMWARNGKEIVKQAMGYAAQRESLLHEHYAKLMNNTSFKEQPNGINSSAEVTADKGMSLWLSQST